MMNSYTGQSVGIGVVVSKQQIELDGNLQTVLQIEHVVSESPAKEAGLQVGDYVVSVGSGESKQTVHELGYEAAVERVRGDAGTLAEFTVYRATASGYDSMPFSVTRKAVTSESVIYGKVEGTDHVGMVRILEFNYTTPGQFSAAIDALRLQGCDSFVFDLRYNPGGLLVSICAVLSFFLDPGQLILSTTEKSGEGEVYYAKTMSEEVDGVTVTESDLGKYKGLNSVVLCNEETASAAELFVANFRDYKLAKIVGTKTFGKGSVQNPYSLFPYGIDGFLKLTIAYYYPPCGEGYDGIGIEPDVLVDMTEEEKNQFNFYKIQSDAQLTEALKLLG